MDATSFFLRQEMKKVESSVSSAVMRLRRATTVREVVQLSHVSVPPTLRFMTNSIPGLRQLARDAEQRADELVNAELERLKSVPTDERRNQIGQLRQREWVLLRGNFPRLALMVERETAWLLAQGDKDAAPSGQS